MTDSSAICNSPFGLRHVRQSKSVIRYCLRLWIQLFHSALKNGESATSGGREGFVMADSASDARASEQEIRQKLIESRAVDVMVAVGPNMLYTVTLEEPVGGNLLEQLKLVA